MEKFSILQSVYKNDNPTWLACCFSSVANATVLPEQIILVKDGPVSLEIEDVLHEWSNKLPVKIVGYEANHGLAYALNFGLQFIETELVARMDSDDICCPDRFEKQLKAFEDTADLALLSGYIEEFNDNPEEICSVRKIPLSHDEIKQYLKSRNAFNHMAVMFRKSAVIDAGGYQTVPFFEDYDLWVRMVQKNYKSMNIPEVLVKARIGNDMIGRRHGLAYARHEKFFLKRQLDRKFITKTEYVKLKLVRIPVRLLPKWALKIVYKVLRG